MRFKSLHLLTALLVDGAQSSVLLWNRAKSDLGARALTFDYANVKVRGVNLGGWFVLERELPRSIFSSPPSFENKTNYTSRYFLRVSTFLTSISC